MKVLSLKCSKNAFAPSFFASMIGAYFPRAQSFLMDRDTLLAHQEMWVTEPQPTQRDLPRLDPDEQRLYDDLRWRRLQDLPLRLEQERVAYGLVMQKVAALS